MLKRALRTTSFTCLFVFLATTLVAACGSDGSGGVSPSPTAPSSPGASPSGITPTSSPTPMMGVSVYFLRDGKVATAHRQISKTLGVATAAFAQLEQGPTADEKAAGLSTALSPDVQILGTSITEGTAVVDVGGDLTAGGTERALQRLAQLTYTATQFRTVKRVLFLRNGDPFAIEGSGIDFTKPVTRATFEDQTPAILVESPTVGETVTSPLEAWGTANTFEAEFRAEVRTAAGKIVAESHEQATSGSGTRGTFRFSLPFATTSRAGALVVYEVSAEDGSRVNVVAIPLVFGK